MITKREAKEFTYKLTIESLRKYSKNLSTGKISAKATQKDVTKVQKAMEELAQKLEKAIAPGRIIEGSKTEGNSDDSPSGSQ